MQSIFKGPSLDLREVWSIREADVTVGLKSWCRAGNSVIWGHQSDVTDLSDLV